MVKIILYVLSAIFFISLIAGLFILPKTINVSESLFKEATSTIAVQIANNKDQELSTSSEEKIISTTTAHITLEEIQRYIDENKAKREEPLKRADNVKALYMTQSVANSHNSLLFKNIEKIIEETEINAVVIDIKEAGGPYMPESLKSTISKLREKGVWVIARICAFRDSSQILKNPQWYIKKNITATTTDGATTTAVEIWKDAGGQSWLDPANIDVQNYIINFSKKAVDFGFDELQFDYIRFPSDGDLKNTVYPVYDGKTGKHEIIRKFFLNLSGSLRQYEATIVLSADIFGYVASLKSAYEIGQRTQDVSDLFDYISFMLYPSHFYNGFAVPADPARNLPAVNFPYSAATPSEAVANHPYEVVLRSILLASDFLLSLDSSTKIRPWLQDFNLRHDTNMGIYYNKDRVRAQIQASQDAGASGWMLWNPSNVYTKDALQIE